MPIYEYSGTGKSGQHQEKSFAVRDFKLDECPVSFITPRSATLVRIWGRAERRKSTLSQMLGINEAWVEDVQELLESAQDHIKQLFDEDCKRRT